MHEGIDLVASAGTPVYAAGDGVVVGAAPNGRYGNWIRIDHGGKLATVYGHLMAFAPGIEPGETVVRGELIGFVGSTGRSTGAHLHFEIQNDGRSANPITHPELKDPAAARRRSRPLPQAGGALARGTHARGQGRGHGPLTPVSDHDVIVIGARCAGAPLAMLLARQGRRVLAVDRARFPSDTVSTHFLWPRTTAFLAQWGLLETLAATGCPPIEKVRIHFGSARVQGPARGGRRHRGDGIARAAPCSMPCWSMPRAVPAPR